MIRPATLMDIEAILYIAQREAQVKYPQLKHDMRKMHKVLVEVISSARNFCWVSVSEDGHIKGAIVAATSENMWAQRQSCHIPMWVSSIPGDGVKLLRELKNWITSRRAVKVAGFAPDTDDIDPRVWKLASMLGFKRYGGAYLLYN
jgi:hypothetical protein